jgi:hypothetical protein
LVTREIPSTSCSGKAFLLERKFAVVPCAGAGPALDLFAALRPALIVASARDIAVLRERLPGGQHGCEVPLVELVSSPDLVLPCCRPCAARFAPRSCAPRGPRRWRRRYRRCFVW